MHCLFYASTRNSRTLSATALVSVGTAAISSTVARRIPSIDPNVRRRSLFLLGPTPGISSSVDPFILLSLTFLWKVRANRWASSRSLLSISNPGLMRGRTTSRYSYFPSTKFCGMNRISCFLASPTIGVVMPRSSLALSAALN